MPGTVVAADKLPDFPGALDKKMARNLKPFDLLKIWVLFPVQLVGKQGLHLVATIDARWQTDGVQHDEINGRSGRAWAKIGRGQALRIGVPPIFPGIDW